MIVDVMINTDVVRANLFEPLIIAEDDENSHVLVAQLVVNGEKLLILPVSGFTVSLHYERADGTFGIVEGVCTLEGKVRITIPDAMLELDDMVRCDICVNRRESITTHALTVENGEIVVTPATVIADKPLRTGLFKIDAQYRVII